MTNGIPQWYITHDAPPALLLFIYEVIAMTRTKDDFKKVLEQQIRKAAQTKSGNAPYGGNVLPILKIYENLDTYEERMSFQGALTDLLLDPDDNKRRFAVAICTDFIDFRKVDYSTI